MRTLTTIMLGLSIVFAPAWVYLSVLFIAIFLHPYYLEGIVAGLLIDTLYGARAGAPLFGYIFGFSATVAIIFVTPLRKYLRFHA
ncbi:MAG TPA: hypothetical protein PLD99_02345 [Parcubacteria group bacterium]|nr:hypothetical protein [Parcubacteria group bacterium]